MIGAIPTIISVSQSLEFLQVDILLNFLFLEKKLQNLLQHKIEKTEKKKTLVSNALIM
jgi:hypothetical protein